MDWRRRVDKYVEDREIARITNRAILYCLVFSVMLAAFISALVL